jgi:hypothetical protein
VIEFPYVEATAPPLNQRPLTRHLRGLVSALAWALL